MLSSYQFNIGSIVQTMWTFTIKNWYIIKKSSRQTTENPKSISHWKGADWFGYKARTEVICVPNMLIFFFHYMFYWRCNILQTDILMKLKIFVKFILIDADICMHFWHIHVHWKSFWLFFPQKPITRSLQNLSRKLFKLVGSLFWSRTNSISICYNKPLQNRQWLLRTSLKNVCLQWNICTV